jgi:hypothetical protein
MQAQGSQSQICYEYINIFTREPKIFIASDICIVIEQ